jgi:GntR family transcriptional regulator / MocR family aminotransferase
MGPGRPDQLRKAPPVAELLVRVDGRSTASLHAQIFDGIRGAILRGAVAAGARLPSSRELAAQLGVARTTVLQALEGLVAEGYVVARARSGLRVAPELPSELVRPPGRPPAPSRPPRLSMLARALAEAPTGTPRVGNAPRPFRPGVPALDLFPVALWSRVVGRVHARASTASLEGGDPGGHPALRKAIAAHLAAARGVRCTWEQVLVTGGTQEAFEEILRLLLDPGDEAWVEDPGYLGAHRAVRVTGGRLVPVPVDAEGLDVAAGIARAPRARAVLLAPSHQYPLGATLSLSRRMALLRWAASTGAVVIEDDYDSEFRHRGRPLMALQGLDEAGRVVYVGTFSKTLFPGLRLGFLVVPPGLVDPIRATRAALAAPAPLLEQAAVAEFIAEGHFARHLRRMRVAYRERGEALLAALRSECAGLLDPHPCDTGMQLSASLPPHLDDRAVSEAVRARGVEVGALSDYGLGRRPLQGLLFGFGCARPPALRTAVSELARAIDGLPR